MSTMILESTKHFPKYQRIEVASLFQDLKTQKVSRFKLSLLQKVILERTSFEQRRTNDNSDS